MKAYDPDSWKEKAKAMVVNLGLEQCRLGMGRGLSELETVRGWLTRQPDTKRQAETREWVHALIASYRKEIDERKF